MIQKILAQLGPQPQPLPKAPAREPAPNIYRWVLERFGLARGAGARGLGPRRRHGVRGRRPGGRSAQCRHPR